MTTPDKNQPPLHLRVLRNTASNYIGKFLTLGTWFFLTPFILRHLGVTTYGLWTLVGSLVGYGTLLDFGIASAVTKYVAEYHARREIALARSLVATTLCLYTALGAIAIVLSIIAAPFFPALFNVPAGERATATWLLLLMGLNIGLSIPCTTPIAVIKGLQRFDLANLISTTATLTSAITTVVILLAGGGVLAMVAANIVILLATQIPTIWLVHRIAPDLRFGWRGAERRLARTVIGYSWSIFVIQVSGRVQTQTDEIVIGAFLPLSLVTPYAIARRLSEVAQNLTDQFMKVLLPLASELHAENDQARLRALFVISTRLTLALFLPIGGTIMLLARPVLGLWVGEAYTPYAYLVVILTLASLIDTSQWPAGSILSGVARQRPLAAMSVGAAAANLALSLVLVQRLGVAGVALGTLIPTVLECFFLSAPYTLRTLGVSFREAAAEILLPSLAPAAPMAAVLLLLRQVAEPTSLLQLAGIATIGVLVYAVGYLLVGARSFEREVSQSLVRIMSRRLKEARR